MSVPYLFYLRLRVWGSTASGSCDLYLAMELFTQLFDPSFRIIVNATRALGPRVLIIFRRQRAKEEPTTNLKAIIGLRPLRLKSGVSYRP